MELFRYEFIVVRWIDLIDMLIMSIIIYEIREVFRKNISTQLVFAGILLFVTWKLVDFLGLKMLKTFLDAFVGLGSLAIVIIFAPEIRKILINISYRSWFYNILRLQNKNEDLLDYHALIEAVFELAHTKTGASIVIKGSNQLLEIEKTGEVLEANLTKRLLVSIFNKYSPLHDGAVLIKGNTITAVRCILPISESATLPPEFGLRHRSAMGVSEISDALVIVVSEERGTVSVIHQNRIMSNLDENELLDILVSFAKTSSIPFVPSKNVKKTDVRRLA
jgi:uncharacterized protein (TIGR00159 family)